MSPFLLIALSIRPGPLEQTLPSGTKIFLSYVGQGKKGACWRPDGHPAGPFWTDKMQEGLSQRVTIKDGDLELILTIKIKKIPPEMHSSNGALWPWQPAVAQIDSSYSKSYPISTAPTRLTADEWWVQRIIMRPTSQTFDVSVKVADSDWKVVDRARFRNGEKISGGGFIDRPTAFPVNGPDLAFPYQVPARWQNDDWKFVAYDRAGVILISAGSIKVGNKTYAYFSGRSKNVDKVKLMVRPYATVRFKNIHAESDSGPDE